YEIIFETYNSKYTIYNTSYVLYTSSQILLEKINKKISNWVDNFEIQCDDYNNVIGRFHHLHSNNFSHHITQDFMNLHENIYCPNAFKFDDTNRSCIIILHKNYGLYHINIKILQTIINESNLKNNYNCISENLYQKFFISDQYFHQLLQTNDIHIIDHCIHLKCLFIENDNKYFHLTKDISYYEKPRYPDLIAIKKISILNDEKKNEIIWVSKDILKSPMIHKPFDCPEKSCISIDINEFFIHAPKFICNFLKSNNDIISSNIACYNCSDGNFSSCISMKSLNKLISIKSYKKLAKTPVFITIEDIFNNCKKFIIRP
ncbi:hypothetical protein PV328_012399, partial [Microctonus aethiopoides]